MFPVAPPHQDNEAAATHGTTATHAAPAGRSPRLKARAHFSIRRTKSSRINMKKTPLDCNQMRACPDASVYLRVRVSFPDHSHRASNPALSKIKKKIVSSL